jgi:hypothetical protein
VTDDRDAGVTDAHRAYYTGFLGVLVVCFTPLKAVTYAVPGAFCLWILLRSRDGISRNKAVMAALVILGLAAVYEVVAAEFLVANYVLSLVTYSAFIPLVIIESRSVASRWLLEKIVRATAAMLGVQGVVGIVQATYGALQRGSFGGANGDRVAGTIYPYLHPELAFSNPMFAVNMSLMLLACLALPEISSRRRVSLSLGAGALILASVVHVLVFLVCAVMMALFVIRARSSARANPALRSRLLAAIVVVGGLSYVALPDNVANISRVAQTAFDLEAVDIPRAILLSRVITELPAGAPLQPFVGLGPGQFSSRASLIASGLYLGGPDTPKAVPLLTPQATRLAADYCFSLLYTVADAGGVVGSSQQPFFSVLSVYTELGLAGLIAILITVVRLVRQLQRHARQRPEVRFHALLLCAAILFLSLLGLQENYWEAPQAIFVGLLLFKVLHGNVVHVPADRQAPPPKSSDLGHDR